MRTDIVVLCETCRGVPDATCGEAECEARIETVRIGREQKSLPLNTAEFIPHEARSPFGWIEPDIAQYSKFTWGLVMKLKTALWAGCPGAGSSLRSLSNACRQILHHKKRAEIHAGKYHGT